MIDIVISVVNRVAKQLNDVTIVCNNSGYQAVFYFDEEWDNYTIKTARFSFGAKHIDVDFEGNICPIPAVSKTTGLLVGVTAGDITTTTGAHITCKYSILCETGTKISSYPSNSVYKKIMELLESKQDKLIPGEGIYINEDNVIYTTSGGHDCDCCHASKVVELVDELPNLLAEENVIYYVVGTKSGYLLNKETDDWIQIIYPPVDLTDYATKDFVQENIDDIGGCVWELM